MKNLPIPRNYSNHLGPDMKLSNLAHLNFDLDLVKRLHANGIISWNLDGRETITSAEYSEYTFLEDIINEGIAIQQLPRILKTLEKPYYYAHSEIFFNFGMGRWEPIFKDLEPAFDIGDWKRPTTIIYNSHSVFVVSRPPRDIYYRDCFDADEDPKDYPSYYRLCNDIEITHKKRIKRLRMGDLVRFG